MDRRRPLRSSHTAPVARVLFSAKALLVALIAAGLALATMVFPSAAIASDHAQADTFAAEFVRSPNTTPPLDNEFIPEERNITDCIGVLQRPGCGSDARGGWRQTAIFVAVLCGLGIIFWRVRANVMKSRQHLTP